MKGFFWYPLLGFIVSLPAIFGFLFSKRLYPIASSINNISLFFHFSFLSFFIIRAIPDRKNDYFFKIIFGIFFALIALLLVNGNIKKINGLAFATANLGLTFFCMIYYYRLFINPPIINLRAEPSFWIITGIFFCMALHIPIYATYNYLYKKITEPNFLLLKSITAFCYTIMHLFFIKAYLCSVHPQKQ